MKRPTVPTVIFPQRYYLPIPNNTWGWCKLCEVFLAAKGVTQCCGSKIAGESLPYFLSSFIVVTRPLAGEVFDWREISNNGFYFSYGSSLERLPLSYSSVDRIKFSQDVFVPEGWTRDVIDVIRRGARTMSVTGSPVGGPLQTIQADVSEEFIRNHPGTPAHFEWRQ